MNKPKWRVQKRDFCCGTLYSVYVLRDAEGKNVESNRVYSMAGGRLLLSQTEAKCLADELNAIEQKAACAAANSDMAAPESSNEITHNYFTTKEE